MQYVSVCQGVSALSAGWDPSVSPAPASVTAATPVPQAPSACPQLMVDTHATVHWARQETSAKMVNLSSMPEKFILEFVFDQKYLIQCMKLLQLLYTDTDTSY